MAEPAAKLGLRFKLPDDLKQVYLSFGNDLAVRNGEDSWTLPMPGRFVIDRHGIVRAVDVDPDYRYRPEPEWGPWRFEEEFRFQKNTPTSFSVGGLPAGLCGGVAGCKRRSDNMRDCGPRALARSYRTRNGSSATKRSPDCVTTSARQSCSISIIGIWARPIRPSEPLAGSGTGPSTVRTTSLPA